MGAGGPFGLSGMGDEMELNSSLRRPRHQLENSSLLPLVILGADAKAHQGIDYENVAAVAAAGILKHLDQLAGVALADEAEDPQPFVEPIHNRADIGLGRPV